MHVTAEPLEPAVTALAAKGELDAQGDERVRARASLLTHEHKWDPTAARRIWSVGLPPGKANVLVDVTKAAMYLHEVKDSIVGAFQQFTVAGVLTGEPLMGVRFNVEDAKIHSDAPHRGGSQIMPCTRAALSAAQLAAGPQLLEPIYDCTVRVAAGAAQGVYQTLRQRRGVIRESEGEPGQVRAVRPLCL